MSTQQVIYRGPITFTITYDGIKWLQPELPAATITVACEADQEDELDEDDLNEILVELSPYSAFQRNNMTIKF